MEPRAGARDRRSGDRAPAGQDRQRPSRNPGRRRAGNPLTGSGADPGEAARAKVNLALHVLGRRADGYHDLDSLIVFADVADRIAAAPSEGAIGIAVEGSFAQTLKDVLGEANLVLRAARALAAAAGHEARGLSLLLTKSLPVAAGLGGGSADAAATLRLLSRYWGLGWTEDRLEALAIGLGADVPMCVRSRPLRARGKGELLEDVAGIPPLPMVLAFPGIGVSTAAAFGRFAGVYGPPLPPLPLRFASAGDVAAWLGGTRNGLEEPAKALVPAVGDVLRRLAATRDCLLARMSGSGSACFALYPSREAAERAAGAIAGERPDWWVAATMTGGSEQEDHE